MQFRVLVSLALAFIVSLAVAADQQRDVDIFAWPLAASKAQTIATLSFNSTDATAKTFTPPTIPNDADIVRVGFYHASGKWSGIATAAKNFAPEKSKKIQLHVRPDGELYHIGFQAGNEQPMPKEASKKKTSTPAPKENLLVEVIKIRPGPVPALNKPVVVAPDGSVEGKEPEKTFLQKYWWAIGLFLLMQVALGGGGGKE